MVQAKREIRIEGEEVHRAPASSPTHLEQISHTLRRHVERANGLFHLHQGLDRFVLEQDQCSHHWSRHSRRLLSLYSSPGAQRRSLVSAYPFRKAAQKPI